MISKVKILEEQSLFDLAIQECGSIESVFDLMKANSDKISHLNAVIPANTELVFSDKMINNKLIVDSYKKTGVKVVNGAEQLTGINYMGIEYNFIIS